MKMRSELFKRGGMLFLAFSILLWPLSAYGQSKSIWDFCGSYPPTCNTKERSLLSSGPGDGSLYIAPLYYSGTLYGPVGLLELDSRWHIAQWGIQEQIPSVTEDLGGGSWRVGNSHAHVTYNSDSSYTLEQDSGNLDTGCIFPPSEVDLILEPNENRAYPGYAEGFIPESQRPTLAQIKSLRVRLTARVVTAGHGNRCSEGIDLASNLLGIIVHSDVAGRGLFYQIVMYDSRGIVFGGSEFPESLLVSDSVEVFDRAPLVPGGFAQTYDLEIADRIKQYIYSLGVDNNLDNWKVFGAYFGSYTNGAGWIAAEYSGFDIIVVTK